jgi:ankyrin repeat protein
MPTRLNCDLIVKHAWVKRALLYGLAFGFSFLTSCASPQPQTRRTSPTGGKRVDSIGLFYAAKDNDVQKATGLLAAGANVNARAGVIYGSGVPSPYLNLTLLHVATSNNSADVARLLVEHGADLNARNLGGETPLHLAARLRDTSIALLLLDHGADANPRDSDGDTPLMKAAMECSAKGMVELLVSHGADVNAKNNAGEAPLLLATRVAQTNIPGQTPPEFANRIAEMNRSPVVEFLLMHGADVNAQTNRGETALTVAMKKRNDTIADLFRSHGAKRSDMPTYADLEDAANAGDVATLRGLLAKLRDRSLVNWRNEYGAGLLWGAAAQNRPEIVKLLLENGADPKLTTKNGETPLHEAASAGALKDVAAQEQAVQIATMLLNAGADVNAKKDDGATPLEFAKANHQDRMADLLRQHGAR